MPNFFFIFLIFFLSLHLLSAKTTFNTTKSPSSVLYSLLQKYYTGHPYESINLNRPLSDFDFSDRDSQFEYGDLDNYKVDGQIGKGKFAKVFKTTHKETGDVLALKLLKGDRPDRIFREISILKELKDAPNFLPLKDLLREEGDGDDAKDDVRYAFFFELFEAPYYKDLFPTLEKMDIKKFLYGTLKTLEYAHSKGIMHRDIKPLNVLMNKETQQVRVIDWGHSAHYIPGQELSVRVATLFYKAPELLLNRTIHDYAIDIWSTGCMLAEMVFLKIHFFESTIDRPDDLGLTKKEAKALEFMDHLDAIARVRGTLELRQYADKFKDSMLLDILRGVGEHKKVALGSFINDENEHLVDNDVLDLLDKMLVYDHTKRITAKDALQHKYFDDVRE